MFIKPIQNKFRFLFAFSVLFFTCRSYSAFSNYNSIILGDQSAGMGGAATALVGDISAAAFYNPGTIGELQGSALSAAVGIYKKFDTVYGKDEDFTKAPLRVNQGFFRSLPASSGSIIRIKDWVFSLSILVPDYDSYKGDLYSKDQNVTTLSYIDESLWVGGAIGKKISKTESMGFSLYYTARNYTQTVSDRSFPDSDHAKIYNLEKTITENALVPILGYYKWLSPKWSYGVSLRFPAVPISGKASIFESYTVTDKVANTLTTSNINEPEKSARVVIPGKLGLGVAWRPVSGWKFTADAHLYEGVSYDDLEDTNFAKSIRSKAIWNLQVGGEWALIRWLKLRGGVFSNYSAHPEPDTTLLRYQADHIDMWGFSANFVFIAGNKIGYTFGGYYTGGRGLSMQRINQSYEVVNKTQNVFTMLMGTSFFF